MERKKKPAGDKATNTQANQTQDTRVVALTWEMQRCLLEKPLGLWCDNSEEPGDKYCHERRWLLKCSHIYSLLLNALLIIFQVLVSLRCLVFHPPSVAFPSDVISFGSLLFGLSSSLLMPSVEQPLVELSGMQADASQAPSLLMTST